MSYLPQINISDFDYYLPKDKIALFPTEKRDLSKLLFYNINNDTILHKQFNDITNLIPQKSLLILNSTKVISARIFMKKPSGGKCEILLIEPLLPNHDPALIMSSKEKCVWKCMIGGRNIKIDMKLSLLIDNKFNFSAIILEKEQNYAKIEFNWDFSYSFSEVISEIGKIPLPPYIDRDSNQNDKDRYQTIYANFDGSIAAPTAGLHFTNDIIKKLENNNINIKNIILHVGPGTFVPVSNDDIRLHTMHDELAIINKSTILAIKYNLENNHSIIAVGTTSVRTIETLFWLGFQLYLNNDFNLQNFYFEQDIPYFLSSKYNLISPLKSINVILNYMSEKNLNMIYGKTKLFIVPTYKFQFINGIITNFHLPKSTLLLLISAFLDENKWLKIYENALKNDYRFLSYGDSSFLLKEI